MLVALTAIVTGLLVAVLALLLLLRRSDGQPPQRRLARVGALLILAAGATLAVYGGHTVYRQLREPRARAEALARLDVILAEPLYALLIQGPPPPEEDPFGTRSEILTLRLRFTLKTGPAFVATLPANLLTPVAGAKGPAYSVPWQTVVDNSDPAGALVATLLRQLVDLRQLSRIDVELVERAPEAGPLPASLRIAPNEYVHLPLFQGQRGADSPAQEGESWVSPYADLESVSQRMDAWEDALVRGDPPPGLRPPGLVMLGVVLFALGAVLSVPEGTPAAPTAASFREEVRPLWVTGLALLLILVAFAVLPYRGKPLDVMAYLVLGTVFPALVLAWSLGGGWLAGPRVPPLVDLALGVLALWVALWFTVQSWSTVAAVLALVQWGVVTVAVYRTRTEPAAAALVGLAVALVAWTAVVRFGWSFQPFLVWFAENRAAYPTALACLVLVLAGLRLPPFGAAAPRPGWRGGRVAADAVAVLVLAAFSLRTDHLFHGDFQSYMTFAHWCAYAGPAELVRAGGWLLWDVPSIYGFLSVLTLAWLPAGSVMQSLYLASAACVFGAALLLFFVLRALGPGLLNWFFSLGVTLAAIFLLPGIMDAGGAILGPHIYPQSGMFRFCWCVVLLAILVWDFRSPTQGRPVVLWAGCLAWLGGLLWSSESAAVCTATWLPSYAFLVLRGAAERHARQPSWPRTVGGAALWLALPLVLLTAALLFIRGYYLVFLGHPPDWSTYVEHSGGYLEGLVPEPIRPQGPFGLLFVAFCVASTAAAFILARRLGRAVALIAGAWGALWASLSYFVAISAEGYNKALFLTPQVCLTLALTLYALLRLGVADRLVDLARFGAVPVLTVVLTASFGDLGRLWQTAQAMHEQGWGYKRIERVLPPMDDGLLEFLRAAGVRPGDSFVYLDVGFTPRPPAWPDEPDAGATDWLPISCTDITTGLLRIDRARMYLTRFIDRARQGGYLLVPEELAAGDDLRWFFKYLETTHAATRTVTSDGPIKVFRHDHHEAVYRLIWYEWKDPS